MKNTFVEINGIKDGKDYFNSIFCPKEKEILKAVRRHILDFFGEKEEEVEKDYMVELSKNIIGGGGAKLATSKEGSEWFSITFKKL